MLQAGPALKQRLAALADVAIARTLTQGGRRVGRPAGEVAAVKSLLLDAMPRVAALWRRVLRPNYKLGITSVFCHSHPQVSFTRPRRRTGGQCELADLLVVIDHYGAGRRRDRRAVLVQAKVLKRPSMLLSKKEEVQFELLSE